MKTNQNNQFKHSSSFKKMTTDKKEYLLITIQFKNYLNYYENFTSSYDQVLKNTFLKTIQKIIDNYNPVLVYYDFNEITLIIEKETPNIIKNIDFSNVIRGDLVKDKTTGEIDTFKVKNIKEKTSFINIINFLNEEYIEDYSQNNEKKLYILKNNIRKEITTKDITSKYDFFNVSNEKNKIKQNDLEIPSEISSFVSLNFYKILNLNLKRLFIETKDEEYKSKIQKLLNSPDKLINTIFNIKEIDFFYEDKCFSYFLNKIKEANKNNIKRFFKNYINENIDDINIQEKILEKNDKYNKLEKIYKYGMFFINFDYNKNFYKNILKEKINNKNTNIQIYSFNENEYNDYFIKK